ncbi:MAG: type II toxin-antitoxin system RelE/ParE family toxin [Coriobacteriia bacterium]|nr:type II toxin-antitoxin system RelE/ParE family toxin [Coriobacteriia bacterium]
MYEIEYYTRANGEQPVQVYLDSLNTKLEAKTAYMIDLLERNGAALREPDSKHLEDGIFELRTKFGSDSGRVLFFFFVEKRIVLTHGFLKKINKTPRREIAKAKRFRSDYLERMGGEQNGKK